MGTGTTVEKNLPGAPLCTSSGDFSITCLEYLASNIIAHIIVAHVYQTCIVASHLSRSVIKGRISRVYTELIAGCLSLDYMIQQSDYYTFLFLY